MRLATTCTAVLFALLATAMATPAMAARELPTYTAETLDSPAPQAQGRFGGQMDTLGDVNGDGVGDVAIAGNNRVYVFSGRTRTVLRTIENPSQQSSTFFGGEIIGLPDVNGDGTRDLEISASGQDVYSGTGTLCGTVEPNGCFEAEGRAYVFSGKTGAQLYVATDTTPEKEAYFADAGFATNDLNGDGIGDFVLTAPGKLAAAGTAYEYSGKDGTPIRELVNPDRADAEGTYLYGAGSSNPGDVTGDGYDDLVLGSPGLFESVGRAYLFNGKTGALVRKLLSPTPPGAGFGFNTSYGVGPGDVNGDGVRDLYVGANGAPDSGIRNVGVPYLISGTDGSIIRALHDPNPKLGGSLDYETSAGDLNGDGTDEILVMRIIFSNYFPDLPPGGAAYIFDPRTGQALISLPGMRLDGPGSSLASPGDINGDGYPDYFLGGANINFGSNPDGRQQGQVIVALSKAPPASPQPPAQPPAQPASGRLATSLVITAKPKRDRRLPFSYRFSGRVRIPAGASPAAVCGGSVRIRLQKGRKTVAKRIARVSTNCTYSTSVAIRTTKKTGGRTGTLRVSARFGGNSGLAGSTARTTVRFL